MTPRAIESGEIAVFVNADFVVTVRHGQASELHGVRLQIEERPDLLRCGAGAVLYAIVDHIVDDYEPVVQAVEADIQEVEHEVFSPDRSNPAERIYTLEREVLEMHRAVAPLAPAVERLARGQFDLVHPALGTYFRDVHDHLLRVSGRIAASVNCCRARCRPTSPRWPCARTTTCARSPRGSRSWRSRPAWQLYTA